MKKYIMLAFAALMTFSILSCTKDPDILASESKLPALQLSSMGYQQSGPFILSSNPAPILQINFGATATNVNVGAFKLEILNGATLVKTVNFPSWDGKDDSAMSGTTPNGPQTISYTLQPTTYPNTKVYSGVILLKLANLGLTAGVTYTVRATASSSDGAKTSVLTQSSFFKVI